MDQDIDSEKEGNRLAINEIDAIDATRSIHISAQRSGFRWFM